MAASTVFFNKHAIVIGPTPPGTGVIAEATLSTSSKSSSIQLILLKMQMDFMQLMLAETQLVVNF